MVSFLAKVKHFQFLAENHGLESGGLSKFLCTLESLEGAIYRANSCTILHLRCPCCLVSLFAVSGMYVEFRQERP